MFLPLREDGKKKWSNMHPISSRDDNDSQSSTKEVSQLFKSSQEAQWWKNLAANARASRGPGSVPGLERFPGVGNGNPLQYSCLENSMDRGSWQATVTEWDMTEHAHARLHKTESWQMLIKCYCLKWVLYFYNIPILNSDFKNYPV